LLSGDVMSWTGILGLFLLLGSIGILASVAGVLWEDDTGPDSSISSEPESLRAEIRAFLRQRGFRRRRLALAGGVALLLGAIFLILLAQYQSPPSSTGHAGDAIPADLRPPPPAVLPGNDLDTRVAVWQPAFFIHVLVAGSLIAFGVLMLVRQSLAARSVGAAAIVLATAASQFHIFHDLKVEIAPHLHWPSRTEGGDQCNKTCANIAELKQSIIDEVIGKIEAELNIKLKPEIKAELKIELKPELKTELKTELKNELEIYLRAVAAFRPVHLADLERFELGRADVMPAMEEAAKRVCDEWNARSKDQDGLLFLIGETDRVPLGGAALSQYESNVGLARARDEQVEKRLLQCGIPAERMLAIVSGPRHTPTEPDKPSASERGHPEDRRVQVWAIWSLRD
jgi:flagellar motor protein MotB